MDVTDKDIILMLAGTAMGFLVAYFFDWLWSKGLTKETARLRNLHELTLYAYFNRDAKVKPRYDAHGKMVGIIVEAAGNAAGGHKFRLCGEIFIRRRINHGRSRTSPK
jgi:hypothetical protein